MFVCVCRAVTDEEVLVAIRDGASTIEDVTRACRAGGDCGACRGMIADMLEDDACPSRRSLPLVGASRAA
jgi:bacterioferritin-associated ferredoxin